MPASAGEAPPRRQLACVIVTHNSHAVLPGLLDGLAGHEPDALVVVVDCGSSSVPQGQGAEVIRLDNVGFGAACNIGADRLLEQRAGISHVVCLNPDVRLQGPSLTQLAHAMIDRPAVGIATGPVVATDGTRQPSAWGPASAVRAAWFASGWQLPRLRAVMGRLGGGGVATGTTSMAHDDVAVDGHVLGGAMIVRRECWDELGGFDENFFLYWEDADLCERARAIGWEVALLPCTPIVHQAGTSSVGITDEQRWGWYAEGAARFAQKHMRPGQAKRLLVALRWGRRLSRFGSRP